MLHLLILLPQLVLRAPLGVRGFILLQPLQVAHAVRVTLGLVQRESPDLLLGQAGHAIQESAQVVLLHAGGLRDTQACPTVNVHHCHGMQLR